MESQGSFKIPSSAIGLDLLGSVLVVLGILSLSGVELPLLSTPTADHSIGWTLIVFGIVFMTAGSLLIVSSLLAKRSDRRTSPTVDRQSH